jgi:hypothetical protein
VDVSAIAHGPANDERSIRDHDRSVEAATAMKRAAASLLPKDAVDLAEAVVVFRTLVAPQ